MAKSLKNAARLIIFFMLLLLIVLLPSMVPSLGKWQKATLYWNYLGVAGNYIVFVIYILIYRKSLSQMGIKLGVWKAKSLWYGTVTISILLLTRIFDLINANNLVLVMPNLNTVFFQLIFVSLGEELFYRGLIQTEFGYWTATLLFGAVHLLNGDLLGALAASVIGAVLGWVRSKTDSVLAAALLHGLVNLLNTFVKY